MDLSQQKDQIGVGLRVLWRIVAVRYCGLPYRGAHEPALRRAALRTRCLS